MDSVQWMLVVCVCALGHVLYFAYLCMNQGVFSVFGRKALPTSSLVYLALAACLPALASVPLITSQFLGSLPDENLDTLAHLFVLSVDYWVSFQLTGYFMQGVKVS